MWRRERGDAEVLRIGRHAVERWAGTDGSLSMVGAHPLPQDVAPRPQNLVGALGALYAASIKGPVTVVIESAWLPVVLVDTGSTLLRAAQVEALVRHRFGMYESDSLDPVTQWELRIEHRAGSRHALAYGLAPRLKQTLATTARSLGLELAGMTSAFAWGWDRLRPDKAWSRSAGWWLWPEQDRALVARIASNEILCLNTAGRRAVGDSDVLRLVEAERARCGINFIVEPISAATWEVVSAPSSRGGDPVKWMEVRRHFQVSARSVPASGAPA